MKLHQVTEVVTSEKPIDFEVEDRRSSGGVVSVDSGVGAANGDAIQVQRPRFLRVSCSNADLPRGTPIQVQGRRPCVSRHLSLRLNEEPGGPTEMALWRHLPQEFTSIKTLLLKLKRTLQEDCTAERMATPIESPTDGLPRHSFDNSEMSAELLQMRSQLHMRDTEIKTLKERLFAAEMERVRWREGLTSRQDKCTQTDGHTLSRDYSQHRWLYLPVYCFSSQSCWGLSEGFEECLLMAFLREQSVTLLVCNVRTRWATTTSQEKKQQKWIFQERLSRK
uniref:serine-rich coiled-coil domain-containing protein 1-like isoform X2 n=1 Tax=Myxine glutinosa TaxID=7769 RepID=UPI00358FD4D3